MRSNLATSTRGQSELGLEFGAPADPAAVASQEDVERVVAVLLVGPGPLPPGAKERDCKRREAGWMTAAEICLAQGQEVTENSKRKVRAIARAAWPGILSAPGMDGFKLLRKCTLDEAWSVERAMGNLERDASIKRKLLLDAIYSGKVGTA